MILRRLLSLVLLGAVLTACASAPVRVDRQAEKSGFEKSIVHGKGFRHVVYENRWAGKSGDIVNVYIEGDGNPWIMGRFIAQNPTPAKPLMLRLMALDPAPEIYLGRPCYFGLHKDTGCEKKYWSSDRYSAAVAESMVAALHAMVGDRPVNLL
ncbi:MAG TPA: alpha/beta hydrolase, partial [Gammaproteobacteria bacterium]